MISRTHSKRDDAILTYNGKFVCSSVNPVKEANDWAQKHRTQIEHVEYAFVFGVGCGYHLAALKDVRPDLKIIAIDCVAEFIQFSVNEHPIDVVDIQFVLSNTIGDLTKSEQVKHALKTFYTILSFAPAQISDPKLYQGLIDFVSARTLEGFHFVTSIRQDLQSNTLSDAMTIKNDQLLSIKDLSEGKVHFTNADVNLYFRALRELVI